MRDFLKAHISGMAGTIYFTHSLTHSLTHLLTHSLTQSRYEFSPDVSAPALQILSCLDKRSRSYKHVYDHTLFFVLIYSRCACMPYFLGPHDTLLCILMIKINTFFMQVSDIYLTLQSGHSIGWTGFTWDKHLFPDPAGFLDWYSSLT